MTIKELEKTAVLYGGDLTVLLADARNTANDIANELRAEVETLLVENKSLIELVEKAHNAVAYRDWLKTEVERLKADNQTK